MFKLFLSIIIVVVFNFFTFQVIATAQEPIKDIYNTFSQIKIDFSGISFIDRVFQIIKNVIQELQKITTDTITNFFRSISDWFQKNIGVSLFDIIKAIGNFIIWILESIIKLIRTVISLL